MLQVTVSRGLRREESVLSKLLASRLCAMEMFQGTRVLHGISLTCVYRARKGQHEGSRLGRIRLLGLRQQSRVCTKPERVASPPKVSTLSRPSTEHGSPDQTS